jgi:hypothetical protein
MAMRMNRESTGAAPGRGAPDDALPQRAEFALRAFEALTHPVLVIDAATCEVVLSNGAAGSRLARGAITCHLLSHGRMSRCDDSADAPCPLERVKREQRPVTVEHIHYDRRGQPQYVEVSAYPLFDASGAVSHVVEVAREVTPERLAARERDQLIAQLRDSLRASRPPTGVVPICASCKRVRGSGGEWHAIEAYLARHTGVECSHSICPDCVQKLYPQLAPRR